MTVLLLFSSPHSFSTGFSSKDWNGHSRSLVLCPMIHFLCSFWDLCLDIVRLEDPIMAHSKISNRVSHLLIFYLLVFYRIHDAMCLNKMSRTSSRNIGPQHKKLQQYISLYTWGTFYPCVHQTNLECLLLIISVFSFIWPKKPVSFAVPVVSDNWICWSLFLDELGNFSWNPPKQHVVM